MSFTGERCRTLALVFGVRGGRTDHHHCDGSDTVLDGLASQVNQLLAADPAEWSLDQLEHTILDVHTPLNNWPRSRPKPWPALIPAAGRSWPGITRPGTGWRSPRTPAGHAGWWVHTARALRDVLPDRAALADRAITREHVRAIRGAPHHR